MTVPGYPVMGTWTKYFQGEVVNLPLLAENAFMPDLDSLSEDQRKRAKLLSQKVEFQGNGEAVPLTGSTGTLYYIDSNGVVRESDVNMLAENYWAINSAFSR